MADRDQVEVLRLAQPVRRPSDCRGDVRRLGWLHNVRRSAAHRRALRRASRGYVPDAVDLTFEPPLRIARSRALENLEFDAGRAGIDDEDGIHGDQAATRLALARRAAA